MQRLQNFLRSALNFGKTKITARIDAINTGLAEENTPQVLLNGGILALMFGGSLFAGITLVRFVIKNLHLFIIGTFLAAALYSANDHDANEHNTKLLSLDMLSCLWRKDSNKSI